MTRRTALIGRTALTRTRSYINYSINGEDSTDEEDSTEKENRIV